MYVLSLSFVFRGNLHFSLRTAAAVVVYILSQDRSFFALALSLYCIGLFILVVSFWCVVGFDIFTKQSA